jgi:hypothetical protein
VDRAVIIFGGEIVIHLLKEKTNSSQLQEMLERYERMIKIVVDIASNLSP